MRFRLFKVPALAAATLLFAGLAPDQSHAQSFFQQLFGFGSAPKKQVRPRPQRRTFQGLYGGRQYGDGSYAQPRPYGGSYRTVCVRTCDGYYFPISDSTSRRKFHRDADRCRASCGGQGRLYYLPKGSTDTDRMRDLTGQSYKSSKNAYKYRKKLVAGCACRAMPWSAAERSRHSRYAEKERRLAEAAARRKLALERSDDTENFDAVAQSGATNAPIQTHGANSSPEDSATIAAVNDDATKQTAPDTAGAYRVARQHTNRHKKASVIKTSNAWSIPSTQLTMGPPTLGAQNYADRAIRQRSRKARVRRKPRRKKKNKPTYALGGWAPASKSKYSWPGD